jgi:NAD(P)-dependent dehydrogenase (short-subunit alcohol dehydrogenase family)
MAGAVIVGAGPGIGQSVALRFAREGLPVAVVARSDRTVRAVGKAVTQAGGTAYRFTADCSDERGLRIALDGAVAAIGLPDVVVYNAAVIRPDALGDLSLPEYLETWAVNVGGALVTAAHVLPAMAARGSGTYLITGGMPEPKPGYVSLSLGKAGVRDLVAVLESGYRASGIHVATVTVSGAVAPGTAYDPDRIAEHYWRLHGQAPGEWDREVVH